MAENSGIENGADEDDPWADALAEQAEEESRASYRGHRRQHHNSRQGLCYYLHEFRGHENARRPDRQKVL